MNGALPARDRGDRGSASRGTSRRARTMPRSGGLVGRIENHDGTTRKAAGVESGGRKERSLFGSAFDGVDPLVANLLAGYDQPVLLRERAARAQHGPRRVLLPV